MNDQNNISMNNNKQFKITNSPDGVFLTILSNDNGELEKSLIIEELTRQQVKEYEEEAIDKAIRENQNSPVKIANAMPEGSKSTTQAEPDIKILMSRDRMEATVEIIMPAGARTVTKQEVEQKLQLLNITTGIVPDAIDQAIQHPGKEFLCAAGLKPVDGENGYIKYYVNLDNSGRPTEADDGTGRVDYKNINLFTIVNDGDLLAEKVPASPGTAGYDITGQVLSPRPGKDVLLPLGKNVRAEDTKVIAALSGQLLSVSGKLNILPVIEIKGDVDLSTGNIEFVGSVVVRGSVQTGFTVKADGNVDIAGTVSGGTVEGKNVIVRMGIQGMNRGLVKAKENVVAKFIENSTVYAENEVQVGSVILHSHVYAGKKVIVDGKQGLIAGGQTSAGEEIRVKNVGTHLAVSTELCVGVNPMLREEYQELKKEIKKQEYSLEQTQKALNILKSMDQTSLPPDKKAMLLKLSKAQFHIIGQLESMRKRLAEIEVAFKDMETGRIRVAESVFPGTKIIIGSLVKPIRETLKFSSFYEEDGEIKTGSYK